MKDIGFKLSDDPKDLEEAIDWIVKKKETLKRQREVRDRAKARLKPLLDEAARKKQERLAHSTAG